jgi:hypothetical protein
MNKKIGRNFEVFTPCDFIGAITQHIPDKSFQLVRYYGWYSNKMRGRRAKQATKKCRPRATLWRSFLPTSRAASLLRSGAS